MLGQTDGFCFVLDFVLVGVEWTVRFFVFLFVFEKQKGKKNYSRWSTMFEECMDFRLGLASVPAVQSTSRVRLVQSAPTGVDKFCVVFSSVYLFVLCKDESLYNYFGK